MPERDPSETWTDEEVVSTKPDGFTSSEDEGRYEGGELVGQGSVGRVLAVYDKRLAREVAFKELASRPTGNTLARFLREARVTARLEHPNIIPIYDSARRDDGVYYYTMRYVRGRNLKEAMAACHTLAERLTLLPHFVDLCQAMAHAHSRGVVHRDIKPGNVMIGEHGETLLVDWGLAKLSEERVGREDEHPTGVGVVMGTPRYMSPEQAHGYIDSIDERSDVWSLGVILYELLAGAAPFRGKTSKDLLDEVRRAEVPPIASHEPAAPPALAAVAEKALKRDPADRYPDARALLDEVQSWQAGALVSAYTYSTWDRIRHHVDNHRLAYTVGAVSVMLLAGLGVVSSLRIVDERDRALRFARQARDAEARAKGNLAVAYLGKARSSLDNGDHVDAELYAAAALELDDSAEARGILANTRLHWSPEWQFDVPANGGCQDLLWLDDETYACVGADGVTVWDGEEVRWTLPDAAKMVDHGGDLLVTAGVTDPIRLYAARTGERVDSFEHRSSTLGMDLSEDGTLLAYGEGRTAVVVDVAVGESLGLWAGSDTVNGLAFLPGNRLVAVTQNAEVTLLDDARGALVPRHTRKIGRAGSVGISARDPVVAVGTGDKEVVMWDVSTWSERTRLVGHSGPVAQVDWSAAHNLVATGSEDHTIRLWTTDGEELARMPGYTGSYGSVAWSPNGRRLVTAGRDPRVRVWQVPPLRRARMATQGGLASATLTPDGRRMATTSGVGRVEAWDTETGERVADLQGHSKGKLVRLSVFSPDGRWLFLAPHLEPGLVVSTRDWQVHARIPDVYTAYGAAFSPDGKHLWVIDVEGARRLETTGWTVEHTVPDTDGRKASLSVEAGWLAWVEDDGVHLYGIDGDVHQHHRLEKVREAELSPDGSQVAVAHGDFTVRIYDREGWVERAVLRGHAQVTDDIAWSADGRWIATASWDWSARVWDPQTGKVRAVLPGHSHRVVGVEFSDDGARLVTASWDHSARVWDASAWTGAVETLVADAQRRHGMRVVDGRRIVSPAR